MPNPLDEAYEAVWTAWIANPAFSDTSNAANVRVGNRLSALAGVIGTKALDKNVNRAPADVTEVMLIPGGFRLTPTGINSKAVGGEQSFTLQILELRATIERLNAVKWETFVALVRATTGQQPFGLSFVRSWRVENSRENRQRNEDNKPAGDWIAVLDIVLEMYWDKSTLL